MSGMPPPGMMYAQPEMQDQQQQYRMRRAGSFNAKMMSQVEYKISDYFHNYIIKWTFDMFW